MLITNLNIEWDVGGLNSQGQDDMEHTNLAKQAGYNRTQTSRRNGTRE
jgi:hypothetical protein